VKHCREPVWRHEKPCPKDDLDDADDDQHRTHETHRGSLLMQAWLLDSRALQTGLVVVDALEVTARGVWTLESLNFVIGEFDID
jgi:hypothetical protein